VAADEGGGLEMEGEPLSVACYSGSRYGERPTSFVWHGARHRVGSIVSEWLEPGCRHFRVRTEDDRLFELCYDEDADRWLIQERTAGRQEGG
jgi:hypothetical protein